MYNFNRVFLILFLVLALLPSCATVFNSRNVVLTVHTNEDATIVHDDKEYKGREFTFPVRRKNRDLKLLVVSDSLKKRITIPWEFSNTFLWPNLFLGFPFSYFIDLAANGDSKIYTYDDEIYVDMRNSRNTYSEFEFRENAKKNRFMLTVPEGNYFAQEIHELGKMKYGSGFFGLGAIYEHQHTENEYYSFTAEFAMDYLLPIPAGAVDYIGEYDTHNCVNVDARNNHIFTDRFSLGYGLSLTRYNYRSRTQIDEVDEWHEPEFEFDEYVNISAGLSFAANYKLTNRIGIGLVYNPSFISFNDRPVSSYSYFVSFRFVFRTFTF